LRLKLLKIAARVVEMASRVRLAFAAACPEAELFAGLEPGSASATAKRSLWAGRYRKFRDA
jgi:hypothetical protein